MSVYLDDGDVRLYHGDALETLASLPDGSVDCCITSPPYYGLRDYGVDGQIGLEETPEAFLARLVAVFREVRRVLRDHGTLWVNLGDSYNANTGPGFDTYRDGGARKKAAALASTTSFWGLPPKNLLMMPARLALALQADGWWLRSDIIWHKPNPMPESVTDRPTSAHEHVFLLTKSPRYWYDAEAIKEASVGTTPHDLTGGRYAPPGQAAHTGSRANKAPSCGRNARNVWTIATQPTPFAHFATFPEELVRRCLLAGCPLEVCRTCGEPRQRVVEREPCEPVYVTGKNVHNADRNDKGRTMFVGGGATTRGWTDCGHGDYRPGIVLDPFTGSGTVAKVARDHARHAIGIDLNADYLAIAARRTRQLGLLTVTA